MGILKRNVLLSGTIAVFSLLACCNTASTVGTSESSLSFSVTTAAVATNPPQELQISIANEAGFYREQNVVNPANRGFTQFREVPFGHLFIDIHGFDNGSNTLYGHSETDIGTPDAHVNVVLRNALTTKTLSYNQELLFRQIATARSSFWDNVPPSATVVRGSSSASLRTTLLSSQQYLYFLFEITDNVFFTEDRPENQFGEMTADAVIIYLCKSPPHYLVPGSGVFPAVRVQCEIGKNLDETCRFKIINFSNNTVRDLTIARLNDDEVNGRILRRINDDPSRRTLELRINKELLALPVITTDNDQLFGIDIRYRDSDQTELPNELCDWQTGQTETDPKTKLASWGYLDITP